MTSFEYKQIGEGHTFRLLRLLKGDEDPIQCQLFESKLPPLGHVEDYAALSYTWGSTSKRPCEIIINGSKMRVTKNVYLALRDLRYQKEDRILWIDALCIDQNNDVERGHQVQQMGSIYSSAERVIIWLGEATYDTDYVMHYMKQLEKEGIKHTSNDHGEQWINIWTSMVSSLSSDQIDLLVEGLQSLLCRNWFKRVWIIQETANAQVAEIVCGSKSVSASIFALTPSLLGIIPDPHCQPILDIMPGPLRKRSWWAENRDLYTMLHRFCNSEATDPRDNIYALLDISSDAFNTDLLRANYEKDLKHTVFDTTLFLLGVNKADAPGGPFFDWTLPGFFGKLSILADEVLKCAINTGHEAWVRLLIARNDVNVDIVAEGQTPLWWAAKNGHEMVVKLLLETDKVDVNWRDVNRRSPLWQAAANGHETVVKLLLDTGKVHVDLKDLFDRTPLCLAADNGHKAVVKLLLETGEVDAGSKDWRGHTPLSQAAEKGHEAVVRLLLEMGKVDVNSADIGGWTPLCRAAADGNETVVKLLLEMDKVDVNLADNGGWTPLFRAAMNGHETIVKLLLETGNVDVDLENGAGQTPLSKAAEYGYDAIVKLLLHAGSVDVDMDSADSNGWTPLSRAAKNGHSEVVKLLLETGKVDVNSEGSDGWTPLSKAAESGHEAVVKLLLETGEVDVGSKDWCGQTPLSRAAENGHEAVVRLLLEKDKNYTTPLWQAVEHGHGAVVKLLLETGKIDVDLKDNNGQTPLSKAAEYGYEAIVKLMLETGRVDVKTTDNFGQTPLSWASENEHEAIVKLLLERSRMDEA